MKHYYAMIMAGGGGTRLWPMSRNARPKQMLPLVEDVSMFRVSVQRLAPLFPPERIFVVTGAQHIDLLREDAPEIPPDNFIVEPSSKNTAPAAGLGITVIQQRDPQATVSVLTADHHIAKKAAFREVLEAAYKVAQEDRIVTLGISPTFAATGFGYIQQGAELHQINGFTCYQSLGFTEKPNVVTATTFIASGQYSWNSGMFIWKANVALQEFQRQQPKIYRQLKTLAATVDTPDYAAALAHIWEKMPEISIDFAIMENARNMSVIPVDIGWSDIGSWDALFGVLPNDKFGNCFQHTPDRVMLETRNTLAYSDKLIVTIGVRDMIIVETDDALLVCHKDYAQEVREVVNHLRTARKNEYL